MRGRNLLTIDPQGQGVGGTERHRVGPVEPAKNEVLVPPDWNMRARPIHQIEKCEMQAEAIASDIGFLSKRFLGKCPSGGSARSGDPHVNPTPACSHCKLLGLTSDVCFQARE